MKSFPIRAFAGALLIAGITARPTATAQPTSGPSSSADAPTSSKAPGSSLPKLDLLGLGEEESKIIGKAYTTAQEKPSDPEAVGEVGILCQRYSKISAGIQFLELAAKLAPRDMKWQYYLGLALEESFEFSRALEAYRAANRIDPTYAPVMLRMADLLREKEPAEAMAVYRKAAEHSPRDARAYFGMGECARLQKQTEEAIKHYQQALEYAPKFAKAHGELARLLAAKGDRAAAGIHSDAEKRGREPPIVKDPLYIWMMSIGATPEFLLDVAGQLIDLGENELAVRVVGELQKHSGYQDQANKLLGRMFYTRQDMEQAVKYFADYVGQFGGDIEARELYAAALTELKRYDDAAKQYEYILKNKPDDLDTWVQAGIVALLRRDSNASHYFDKVLRQKRRHAGACVGVLVALLVSGDFDTAQKIYANALRPFPSPEAFDPEVNSKLLLVLGTRREDALMPIAPDIFVKFGDLLAKNNYPQSAERYRDPLGTIAGAAERAAAKGDFAQAFQLIQHSIDCDEGGVIRGAVSRVVQAIYRNSADSCSQFFRDNDRVAQKDATLANMLAWVRATSAEAAIRDGKEAIRLASIADKATGHKNPEVLDTLAAAYAESGDFDRAVQILQEALQLKATTASNGRTARLRQRLEMYEKKTACRN